MRRLQVQILAPVGIEHILAPAGKLLVASPRLTQRCCINGGF